MRIVDLLHSHLAPHLRALVLTAVCLCTLPVTAVAQDSTRIIVSPNGDRITITAPSIARGQLLELLRTKYQIEVRPYDAPAERITVNIVNQPIDSAIAAIMPKGSRYIVRLGDRDVAMKANSVGEKRGAPDRREARLPSKRNTPLRNPQGDRFKPDPRRVRERPPVEGRGLKPVPESSRDVPAGRGPKVARSPAIASDSTLRISFIIRAPDSIMATRAVVIEGGVADSTLVRGPFLFALRDAGGRLVFFGSLVDPLEEHSYIERTGQHGQARAREGIFAISLPARLAPQLGALRLDFYDARNVSLPPALEAGTFERAAAQARTLARLDGRVLLSTLREGPR